jgi:hypothetical protein
MKTQIKVYPLKHLIVMDASGTLDLEASKAALALLVANPGFNASDEVLLDLRDVECEVSTTDLFEIAELMATSRAGFNTTKRTAVLVENHRNGHLPFNKAQFLELCADNRGLNVHAFEDRRAADEWLSAEPSSDGKFVGTLPKAVPPMLGDVLAIS